MKRYFVIQCDAMRCDAMRCDAMRCDAMRCDAMRCDAMRCDAMRCDAMRCDAMRYSTEVTYDTYRDTDYMMVLEIQFQRIPVRYTVRSYLFLL